jgi:hypothetical protein
LIFEMLITLSYDSPLRVKFGIPVTHE